MPECIFGCARLNRANQNAAPDWNNIPIAPPLSMQEKFISPIHAAESIDDNQEKPRRDVDHGTFRLVSFMRHRNTLLEMWNLLAGQDTSFGGKSPTDEIASLDLVCPAGEGSERNPIYRQCGKTGEVVQHMNELFEAAEIVKPMFEASLIRIATECSLSTTGRASSTSPTSTRSGLVISKIKSVARVAEKIREKYLSVSPGPACSWVFDVLRASFVCDSQEQIFHVYEALRDDPDIKIIRVKNRFLKPTPAGFRDILVNVQMTSPGLNGCTFNYACEVQITHVDLRQYEIEHDTRALYQVFWPLLTGTEENACKKLTLILKIISLVTPFVESLVPLAVEKRISQVEDILKKHYDDIYLRDDIESLRDWTPVLESINNLPLAEKNQRKVIQLVSQLHGKASIAVAYENMHLGHILQLKKKYGDSFSCYATGIKCIASVLGKASAVVEDTVLVLATLRNLERNVAEVTESDVNKIRLDIFGTGSFLCGNDSAVDSSIADDLASCLLVRQHSETHHSAYDSAPLNYSTKPPEMLLPIPDLWDLVSSSDSEFDNEEDSNHHS